jgi:hypothetical protein
VHGDAGKEGSTPIAFMASVPRRGWQKTSVYLPARAQWTQRSLPAARSPVSSKPATPLRQELPGMQAHDDRGDPRPVLNRRVRSGRGAPFVACPHSHRRPAS